MHLAYTPIEVIKMWYFVDEPDENGEVPGRNFQEPSEEEEALETEKRTKE